MLVSKCMRFCCIYSDLARGVLSTGCYFGDFIGFCDKKYGSKGCFATPELNCSYCTHEISCPDNPLNRRYGRF